MTDYRPLPLPVLRCRLLSSHRHLERVNHDLEDKILTLVQENDREQTATMAIHEDIHNKLKLADKRVEEVIHEKVRALSIR